MEYGNIDGNISYNHQEEEIYKLQEEITSLQSKLSLSAQFGQSLLGRLEAAEAESKCLKEDAWKHETERHHYESRIQSLNEELERIREENLNMLDVYYEKDSYMSNINPMRESSSTTTNNSKILLNAPQDSDKIIQELTEQISHLKHERHTLTEELEELKLEMKANSTRVQLQFQNNTSQHHQNNLSNTNKMNISSDSELKYFHSPNIVLEPRLEDIYSDNEDDENHQYIGPKYGLQLSSFEAMFSSMDNPLNHNNHINHLPGMNGSDDGKLSSPRSYKSTNLDMNRSSKNLNYSVEEELKQLRAEVQVKVEEIKAKDDVILQLKEELQSYQERVQKLDSSSPAYQRSFLYYGSGANYGNLAEELSSYNATVPTTTTTSTSSRSVSPSALSSSTPSPTLRHIRQSVPFQPEPDSHADELSRQLSGESTNSHGRGNTYVSVLGSGDRQDALGDPSHSALDIMSPSAEELRRFHPGISSHREESSSSYGSETSAATNASSALMEELSNQQAVQDRLKQELEAHKSLVRMYKMMSSDHPVDVEDLLTNNDDVEVEVVTYATPKFRPLRSSASDKSTSRTSSTTSRESTRSSNDFKTTPNTKRRLSDQSVSFSSWFMCGLLS